MAYPAKIIEPAQHLMLQGYNIYDIMRVVKSPCHGVWLFPGLVDALNHRGLRRAKSSS